MSHYTTSHHLLPLLFPLYQFEEECSFEFASRFCVVRSSAGLSSALYHHILCDIGQCRCAYCATLSSVDDKMQYTTLHFTPLFPHSTLQYTALYLITLYHFTPPHSPHPPTWLFPLYLFMSTKGCLVSALWTPSAAVAQRGLSAPYCG